MRQELKAEHFADKAMKRLGIRKPPRSEPEASAVAEKICIAVEKAEAADAEWGIDFPNIGGTEKKRRSSRMSEGPKLKVKCILTDLYDISEPSSEFYDPDAKDVSDLVEMLSKLQYEHKGEKRDYFLDVKVTGKSDSADIEFELDPPPKSPGKKSAPRSTKKGKKISYDDWLWQMRDTVRESDGITRIISWEPQK